MWWIIGAIALVIVVLLWSCLVVAKRADEEWEDLTRRMEQGEI